MRQTRVVIGPERLFAYSKWQTWEGRSVRTALVYEGHLAPIVEADDFFDSIVPVQDLMGLPR